MEEKKNRYRKSSRKRGKRLVLTYSRQKKGSHGRWPGPFLLAKFVGKKEAWLEFCERRPEEVTREEGIQAYLEDRRWKRRSARYRQMDLGFLCIIILVKVY